MTKTSKIIVTIIILVAFFFIFGGSGMLLQDAPSTILGIIGILEIVALILALRTIWRLEEKEWEREKEISHNYQCKTTPVPLHRG